MRGPWGGGLIGRRPPELMLAESLLRLLRLLLTELILAKSMLGLLLTELLLRLLPNRSFKVADGPSPTPAPARLAN